MSSRKEQTRERILKATLRLLLEHGFRGFSLERVAREAGVTRQAVYLHFQSKARLLEALVVYIPIVEGEPPIEVMPAADAMNQVVRFTAGYLPRIDRFVRLIHAVRDDVPEAAAAWRRRAQMLRHRSRKIVKRMAREGALADGWSVEEAADVFWAVAGWPVYDYLVLELGWSPARYQRALAKLVRATFIKSNSVGG
ncbi:MAG TPA: helix-turn-helix domain-containing protein [Candidatus Acidoferrum sp.]|nr:helix-turn-helix domain-containing protein [Candidatus Acidoferrum sp.]